MKKILLAFEGDHFSDAVFSFVNNMNKSERILAVGVFLPAMEYAELLYSLGGLSGPVYYPQVSNSDMTLTEKNIAKFEDMCRMNGIEYRVHTGFARNAQAQLREETRYADLLVLSSELFYENLGEDAQQEYIEKVLHKAECPVVLIPEHYPVPQSVVLAYDGSESCVHAIKQFAYLFPEYRKLKTLLIYTNTGNGLIPGKDNIQELASRHFEDLVVFKLKLSQGKEFEHWVMTNPAPIVVSGAYGRSLFSELLRKSFIKEAIHSHKTPIFIAHR